jgi:hypothetical protein
MIDQLELMRILERIRGDAVVMPVFRANGAWSQVSNNPIRDVPRGYRLPDITQNHPSPDVASQPDFYYEREGVSGACVFVDGSDHLDPARQERDAAARRALEDRGYRVITIRFDLPREAQVNGHPDVFGVGG